MKTIRSCSSLPPAFTFLRRFRFAAQVRAYTETPKKIMSLLQSNGDTIVPRNSRYVCYSRPSLCDFKSSRIASSMTSNRHQLSSRAFFSTKSSSIIESSIERTTTCLDDFFGETVTFIQSSSNAALSLNEAMEALDTFQLCVITRGKTCTEGGDSEGDSIQASHSAAIAWAELLRQAHAHNNSSSKTEEIIVAPMMAVAAVAPLICQTGVDYVRYLDRCLAGNNISPPDFSILAMAQHAVSHRDSPHLSNRERLHLKALNLLLHNRHTEALSIYIHILTLHPGDVLALALAMDIAYVVGSTASAFRAATAVSRYVAERGRHGASLSSSFSGYNVASAWVALGLAMRGKYRDAEILSQSVLRRDSSSSGGVVTAALSHVFDGEGRITEGVTLLAGYDGLQNFRECGWLDYDAKLSGWGARFVLDRDGESGGNLALRIYDEYFAVRLAHRPSRRSPRKNMSVLGRAVQAGGAAGKSLFGTLFSSRSSNPGPETKSQRHSENQGVVNDDNNHSSDMRPGSGPSKLEDVLAFLPPTPQLLTDATLLLLRLTLAEVVSEDDERWNTLRNAWRRILSEVQRENDVSKTCSLQFFPLADAVSALLVDISVNNFDVTSSCKQGLFELGKLMSLGMSTPEEQSKKVPADEQQPQWSRVVSLLASSIEGHGSPSSNPSLLGEKMDNMQHLCACDQELRPIIEHALCHAAVLSNNYESLNVARSICSEGVSLRPNSPEIWWRYSLVLDVLGDSVAAQDARMASTSFGSGVRGVRAD